ncbi:MAG: hypothetical protein KGL15_04230 [Acidobacteriota bacterium]|nr:hypothetical protein [Acidobacteriota bacterium]
MTRVPAVWLLSTVIGLAATVPVAVAATKTPSQINPAVQLQALSCASSGNCSAIGGYDDGLGDSQGLLVSESHGHWGRAVQAQAPAGAGVQPFKLSDGGGLVDVSCPGAGECVAIGRYTDSRRVDHGVLFSQTHGRWGSGQGLRLPANAVTPPKPKSTAVEVLGIGGISCGSVGNCVAVGNYESNAEVWDAMLIVERHGHWGRAIEAPMPAGAAVAGQNAALLSVTCDHAGQCSAAGEYVDASGHQQSLLVSGSGHTWSAAPAPTPPSDANSDPNIIPSSIACADTGACAAVGTYINPLQNSLGLLLNEAGGQWANSTGATLPADAAPAGTVGDQTVVLSSVACPQAGACTAVGWYFDNDENGQGLLITQNGGAWQPGVKVTLPSNAVGGLEKQSAGLDGISCATPGNCLATGVYTDIGYNSQGLLLVESGGVWQIGVESPLPRNASGVQYAAATQADCTGVGDCTVIGQYNDHRGNVLGYLLSEQGATWGHATELGLPPVSAAEARRSLLAILTPVKATTHLAQIRSSRRFIYDYQAVEPGTAATSWYASHRHRRVLIARGSVRVKAPGRVELKLHLTRAGRTLIAHSKHVRVAAQALFTPRRHHGRAASAHASFTLS